MIQTNFEDLFFATDPLGLIGPLALVILGFLLLKREVVLAVLAFVVDVVFLDYYFSLIAAGTAAYWNHVFVLMIGMLLTVVYPLWDR